MSTKVTGMEEKADGVHVTFEGDVEPKTQVFDQVLVSIGRRPNGSKSRVSRPPAWR